MRNVYTNMYNVRHVKDTFSGVRFSARMSRILDAIRSDIMSEEGVRGTAWTTFTTPSGINVTIFDRGAIIVRDIRYRNNAYREVSLYLDSYGEVAEVEFDRGFMQV